MFYNQFLKKRKIKGKRRQWTRPNKKRTRNKYKGRNMKIKKRRRTKGQVVRLRQSKAARTKLKDQKKKTRKRKIRSEQKNLKQNNYTEPANKCCCKKKNGNCVGKRLKRCCTRVSIFSFFFFCHIVQSGWFTFTLSGSFVFFIMLLCLVQR